MADSHCRPQETVTSAAFSNLYLNKQARTARILTHAWTEPKMCPVARFYTEVIWPLHF